MDLERLRRSGNENQPVETKGFAGVGGNEEMANVGRIESPAEYPDSHVARSPASPARGRTAD